MPECDPRLKAKKFIVCEGTASGGNACDDPGNAGRDYSERPGINKMIRRIFTEII